MVAPMLILGTAQIDPQYGVTRQTSGTTADIDFRNLLIRAGQLGIEALDTASAYPAAHALINQSYWDGPIHTKISNVEKASEELMFAKKELGRELLDLVYFHNSSIAIRDPRKARSVARDFLDNGVSEVGISIYSPDEFEAALQIPEISVIQVPLNLFDQRFAHYRMTKALQAGKKLVARSVFLQGLLLRPIIGRDHQGPSGLTPHLDRFFDACTQAQVSPLYACLDFVLQSPQIFGFIVGLDNLEQAQALIATLASVKKAKNVCMNFDAFSIEEESLVDPRRWR